MKKNVVETELGFLRRLTEAPGAQAVYSGGMLEFAYYAELTNRKACLEKIREVMEVVDKAIVSGRIDRLPVELPSWFMQQFIPKPDIEVLLKRNDEWHNSSPEKRAQMDAEREWFFEGWIYWLMPENRQWLLKSIEADERFLHIVLAVEGLPFPVGALEVLVQFCAAPEQVELVVS